MQAKTHLIHCFSFSPTFRDIIKRRLFRSKKLQICFLGANAGLLLPGKLILIALAVKHYPKLIILLDKKTVSCVQSRKFPTIQILDLCEIEKKKKKYIVVFAG